MTRTFCFSLHKTRLKLLGKWLKSDDLYTKCEYLDTKKKDLNNKSEYLV